MDKRKRENSPVLRFLRAFSFPAKAFGLSRAPWETRFAKRERRESISFFAHIFSTNIFLDRNERFVHLASISSTRDVNDEWTTHSIWPPNLTPFRLNKQKNKKRKKSTLSARKATRGTYLGTAWFRRSSDEIRDLRGSERRGCGEHFLFACRVCSFSTEFRWTRHHKEKEE